MAGRLAYCGWPWLECQKSLRAANGSIDQSANQPITVVASSAGVCRSLDEPSSCTSATERSQFPTRKKNTRIGDAEGPNKTLTAHRRIAHTHIHTNTYTYTQQRRVGWGVREGVREKRKRTPPSRPGDDGIIVAHTEEHCLSIMLGLGVVDKQWAITRD
jgi:hypothetical protein